MILTERQIVWTSTLGRDSLSVALNREFAAACMAYQLQDEKAFAAMVWRQVSNKPLVPSDFLDLHSGLFLKGVYTGDGGVSLTLDLTTLQSSKRPITYCGHNEDHLVDRVWLMEAFQAWAYSAMVMLQWQ